MTLDSATVPALWVNIAGLYCMHTMQAQTLHKTHVSHSPPVLWQPFSSELTKVILHIKSINNLCPFRNLWSVPFFNIDKCHVQLFSYIRNPSHKQRLVKYQKASCLSWALEIKPSDHVKYLPEAPGEYCFQILTNRQLVIALPESKHHGWKHLMKLC